MAEKYSAIIATDADQTLAVSNSAVQLTEPAYFSGNGVTGGRARCQVRDAAVLVTTNGTAPTAADESTGTKINVGDFLILNRIEIANANFIRATGTDGAMFITYEKLVN